MATQCLVVCTNVTYISFMCSLFTFTRKHT